jgi:hypothetical protein
MKILNIVGVREEGIRTYFVFNPVSAVFRLLFNRFATILPQSLFMRSKLHFLCLGGKGGIRTLEPFFKIK